MNMKRKIAVVLLAVILLTSCSQLRSAYQNVSLDKAYTMINDGDTVIIDSRKVSEYDSGHIPGAICIPDEMIADLAEGLLEDKDQTIIVYGSSDDRSREAAEKLAELGFTKISVFGGLNSWPYDLT